MSSEITLYNYSELSASQITQYKRIVRSAFPDILFHSEVVKYGWDKVEHYFPEYQLFFINDIDEIVGFLNALPFHWSQPIDQLPDEGWDWLMEKGILDFEEGIIPNSIGGLQIIVSEAHLGNGYSKMLIAEGKKVQQSLQFDHFLIPIRPTFKSKYPLMPMEAYINLKTENKIYDPWIRTHLSSGAKIIKICPKAMHVFGDVQMWNTLVDYDIQTSGEHIIPGALNPVSIDVDKDYGEYYEDNIWIDYSS